MVIHDQIPFSALRGAVIGSARCSRKETQKKVMAEVQLTFGKANLKKKKLRECKKKTNNQQQQQKSVEVGLVIIADTKCRVQIDSKPFYGFFRFEEQDVSPFLTSLQLF